MDYNNLKKEDLVKEIKNLNKTIISLENFDKIFEVLLNNISDAVVLTDKNGNLYRANNVFINLFGIKDNLKYFNLRSFNTSDGTNLKNVFTKALAENKPQQINIKLGNSEYATMLTAAESSDKKFLVVLKKSESSLPDDSSLIIEDPAFPNLINYINLGISIINSDMQIVLSNNKMKEYFPDLDDSKKYTCYKFYNKPPKNEPCDYCPTLKTFKDGNIHETVTDTPINDAFVNFRVISSPVKDYKGNVKYVIEIVEDVSDKKLAEIKLKEQVRFSEYLMDAIPGPFYYKDITGKFLMCNTAFSEYFGISKEDINGKTAEDVYFGLDKEIIGKMDLKLLKKGKIQTHEFSVIHSTKNEIRDLILTKALFYDFNGDVAGIVGVMTDITERKIYERKLVEHQRYISNLIDTANIIILSLNPEGKIVLFNKKAEEITGFKLKEVKGKNFFELIVPKNKYPFVYETFLSFFNKKQISTEYMENYILTKKGQERLISWRNSEVKENGDLTGVLSFGIDITERLESDAVIKKLTKAVEQTSDLIFITDASGKIEYVNPAFTSITGYSKEEVIGNNPNLLKSYQMDEKVYAELWKTITSGKTWYGEFINKKKNGELAYLYGSVSPIKDNMNNITNYISIYSDVSRIKSAYEELKKLKDKVESADRIKYSLLTNMTNELRTPLINIIGFTEVLNNEIKDAWQNEILNDIRNQGKKLLRTLSLILKLSQLESDEIKPNIQKINFNQLTEEIFAEFKQSAKVKGLEFIESNAGETIYIQSDHVMLKEIIQNLLDNAVKFTEKGFIKTGFNIIAEDGRQYALLTVKDSGTGIPKDRAKMIFTEFVRADDISGNNGGCGLGLAVSYNLAKLLECKLAFKSVYKKGTEFSLRIPLITDDGLAKYDFENGNKFRFKSKDAVKPRVLVVEDNLSNINIVEIFLSDVCSVDSVTTGEDALKIIKKKDFDIIMMDINLGKGMNGIITAREIFKTRKFGNVPIIAVTGYALYSDREKLLSEGFIDYLAKPFTKNQLVNLILKYVKK